jgi:hypothetical protein
MIEFTGEGWHYFPQFEKNEKGWPSTKKLLSSDAKVCSAMYVVV